MNLRGWPEIGPDGGVLLTPYVPSGITGIDDDDDLIKCVFCLHNYSQPTKKTAK